MVEVKRKKYCSVVAFDRQSNMVIDWVKEFSGNSGTAMGRFLKSVDRYAFDNGLEIEEVQMKVIER